MLKVRHSEDRGNVDHGWLNSRFTFSFASYQDRLQQGFRKLRVINEDRVEPGQGFGQHAHEDMEILSFVIEGELNHQDNMGNSSTIRPGELQRMSAGRGIVHSESNPSPTKPAHFLQIWILPETQGLAPSYEQICFADRLRSNVPLLIGSRDGREDSIVIHQDVNLYTCSLNSGASFGQEIPQGRHAWVQMISGNLTINGISLCKGDGCAISSETRLIFSANKDSNFLTFDME